MRRLILVTVLCLACLTRSDAASVTGQVNLRVGPSSTVPAPAAAAGFTNHIVAVDFSSPAYSNPANWLVNCGASTSVSGNASTWHWYIDLNFTGGAPSNMCNNAAMVADPPYAQVLKFTFPISQGQSGGQTENLEFPAPYTGGSYAHQYWLPTEFYVKVVLRVPQSTWIQPDSSVAYLAVAQASVPAGGGVDPNQWIDTLVQESESNVYGAASHGVINDYPGNYYVTDNQYNWPGGNYTSYQTIEAVITSDESTAEWECIWLNANSNYTTGFVGCNQLCISNAVTPSGGCTPNFTFNIDITKAHDFSFFNGQGMLHELQGNDMPVYYKSFDVWTCPGVPGGNTCPGTMITHWPFP